MLSPACARSEEQDYYVWGDDDHRQITGLCACGGVCESASGGVLVRPHKVTFREDIKSEDILQVACGYSACCLIVSST